jgi:transcriptional regulator with PAS, ATPase and Fis domain
MRKVRVLAVAPYSGLMQLILSTAKEYDYEINAVEGDLEAGLSVLRGLAPNDYDVILSRGGTAELLARNTDIPVVPIGISGYDILRIIRMSQNYAESAVILGFDQITRGFRSICELLHIDIDIHTIERWQEVEPLLSALKKCGDYMVIGDVITIETASRLGMNNMLVTSGVESVREAFDEIGRYVHRMLELRHITALPNAVLGVTPDPVLVFSNDGSLLASYGEEDVSTEFSAKLSAQVAGTIKRGIHFSIQKSAAGRQYQVRGKIIATENRDAAAAFYLREITSTAGNAAVSLSGAWEIDKSDFNVFSGENEALKIAVEQAATLAAVDASVLLEGEQGSGKLLMAKMLHLNSRLSGSAMLVVDCAGLLGRSFASVMKKELEPLLGMGEATVYFRRINLLDTRNQSELLMYLNYLRGHRLIVSSDRDLHGLVATGDFSEELFRELKFARIWLPPLRERINDLDALFHRLLAKANAQLGKQIVGIEQPALKLLREHDWVGNMDQLARVVADAVQIEPGPYITRRSVSSLLSPANQAHWSKSRYSGRKLEDVEKEIILTVLNDENMNQSLAAKRLGISRTTLWRRLREPNFKR